MGSLQSGYQANINQNQVVSDVVSALQPDIEAAIAAALASLGSSSSTASSSGLAATGGATAAVQEVAARYNYEYKVADDEAQNYISKTENRDGDTPLFWAMKNNQLETVKILLTCPRVNHTVKDSSGTTFLKIARYIQPI